MQLLTLTSPHATATLSPYGGQVMSCIPYGQPDLLWQTPTPFLQQALATGTPLRGGIPLCWPWFRQHPTMAAAPSHGLARTAMWQVMEYHADTATLQFETDGTHPAFPYRARATVQVQLSDQLHLQLTTTNLDTNPFTVTQALHTYLRVSNLTDSRILGLEQSPARFITPDVLVPATGRPLQVSGFHEHLYQQVPDTLKLIQPETPPLTLHHHGTTEAVVWNPGPILSQNLDIPPDAYTHFICLEAVHIETAPTLTPGVSVTLGTTLSVTPHPH